MKCMLGMVVLGVASSVLIPREARACGGCFHQEPTVVTNPSPSVVTGHRMAISISPTRTVLWDQVSYDGEPEEFAWVLPVTPGTRLEVGTDAWFETLDAATRVVVAPPRLDCGSQPSPRRSTAQAGGGAGCGSTTGGYSEDVALEEDAGPSGEAPEEPDPTVRVLHEGTAGPYETVTVRSTDPGALSGWLRNHGYAIPEDVAPIITDYEAEGFDFIALRLRPGVGVRQMKPVRVIYPGPVFSFPLRMVSAGTGEQTSMVVFVISEGRWSSDTGANVMVDTTSLSYDFRVGRSNYESLRLDALSGNNGNAWLTAYARRGALFAPALNPITGRNTVFVAAGTRGSSDNTVAGLFLSQALTNGESTDGSCREVIEAMAGDNRVVVDPCTSGICRDVTANEIDHRRLRCGGADDLATALVGNHPGSLWITRLEANLPRTALAEDLVLGAAGNQLNVENNLRAPAGQNSPCPLASSQSALARRVRASDPAALVTVFGPTFLGVVFMRRWWGRRRTS
ncbi:MAG: DUF2330 domain-containing protein [Myxococcota bacterium]